MTTRRDGDVGVLDVGGEVRLEIASQLREAGEALLAEGVRHLLLNLQAVVFIDSASLAAVIQLDNEVLERNGKLVLFNLSPAVERVLVNSGLSERFPVAAGEAEARALIG